MLLQVYCITVGSGVEKVLAEVIPMTQDWANVLEHFPLNRQPQHSFTHSHASIPIIPGLLLTDFPPWLPSSNNINWDSVSSHACLWKRVISTTKIYTCKPVPPVGLKVHTQLAQLTRFLINLAACERCKSRFFLAKVLTNFSVYHTFNDLDEVPKVMLWWSFTKPLFLHFVVVFWNSVSLFVSSLNT